LNALSAVYPYSQPLKEFIRSALAEGVDNSSGGPESDLFFSKSGGKQVFLNDVFPWKTLFGKVFKNGLK
jgi:hypothetical protein